MNLSLLLSQALFSFITILFSVTFATRYFEGGLNGINGAVGLLGGAVLSSILFGAGALIKRFNLRSFNTTILGFFFGYLMAQAILFSLQGVLGWEINSDAFMPLRFVIFLFSTYIGMVLTLQAAQELHISFPFVEFNRINNKKKDILVDLSILSDPRIIDLAASGLLDHHLIMPRFAVKELVAQAETGDENTRNKAYRSLELIKKLEGMPSLDLRYIDTDFSEIKDPMQKLIRLARSMDTHVITSDINRIQQSSIEGIRIINIHMLSNALKPITQAGESINIKIQRYGKEARQGVGYLEDGTMVVVNGGAEFIGETIKAYVLSVKHTSSGRMIFCNAAEEGLLPDGDYHLPPADEAANKTFLTL